MRQSCALRQTGASKAVVGQREEEGRGGLVWMSLLSFRGWEEAQWPGLRGGGGATSKEPAPRSKRDVEGALSYIFSHMPKHTGVLKWVYWKCEHGEQADCWPQWALSKVGSYSINWINSQWQLQSRLGSLQCFSLPLSLHTVAGAEKTHISGKKKHSLLSSEIYNNDSILEGGTSHWKCMNFQIAAKRNDPIS